MPARNEAIERHYSAGGLERRLLAAIEAAGKDLDALSADDLAPVDEFHTRQRAATEELAQLARPAPTDRVLDAGCGLGGPSRYLARRFGCRVTGVDLTREFCEVASALTRRLGLADRVEHRQADLLDLPFPDGAFTLVWAQNIAMNIADRARLYAEMGRVLAPGGRLAIQDMTAGPGGPPHYPVAWARDASISFLLTADETREALLAAGFAVLEWIDRTDEAIQGWRAARPPDRPKSPLGLHLLFGDQWPAMAANSRRNLEENRTRLVNAVLLKR